VDFDLVGDMPGRMPGSVAADPDTVRDVIHAAGRHRPGTAAADPARQRGQLAADPDLEGIESPDFDTKLDRIDEVMSRLPDPVLRVRPVRAAVHPSLPQHLLGRA
jgi:hypothetical protein